MAKQRRSHEQGHQRKFLVILDETPECHKAIRFAAERALHTGGMLVFLYVIPPSEFQHWLGVEDIMRAEAMEAAEAALAAAVEEAKGCATIDPECVIREGAPSAEIISLIEEDEDIAILVLAAGVSGDGPGPLVTALVQRSSGDFPIPVTIVPGNMSDQEIDALA